MKPKHAGLAALLAAALVGGIAGPGAAAEQPPEGSQENPYIVTDRSQVPEGATSTGEVVDKCETFETFVLTIPGSDEQSHEEVRFKRDVPGEDEVSHEVYSYVQTIPAVEGVKERQYGREVPAVEGVKERQYEQVTPAVEGVKEALYKRVTPAVEGVKERKYERTVDVFKTQQRAKYQKFVTGKIEKREKHWLTGWGSWKNDGTFGYEPYGPGGIWGGSGSFQTGPWLDSTPPEVLEQGGHNDTSATYGGDSDTQYHKVSQQYRYQKVSTETREVKSGTKTETSGWMTEKPAGSGWVQTAERWKVEPKDEVVEYSGWVTESPGDGWTKVDERWKVEPKDEVRQTTDWITEVLLAPWVQIAERWKVEPVEAFVLYFNGTPQGTRNADEASWVTYTPTGDWAAINERWKIEPKPAETKTSGEVTEPLGEPWVLLPGYPRKVVDRDAVPGYTEFYVVGGSPSRNVADASWVRPEQAPDEGWTQFDQRTVKDAEAVPEQQVYYLFRDGKVCPPETPEEPETPVTPEEPATPETPKPPTVGTPIPPVVDEPDAPSKRITTLPKTGTDVEAASTDVPTAGVAGALTALVALVAGAALTIRRRRA